MLVVNIGMHKNLVADELVCGGSEKDWIKLTSASASADKECK